MLLNTVVNGTVLDLAGQANASPEVLDELALLLLVGDSVRYLLKFLTLAIHFKEVKGDGLVGALEVLSLGADSTFELQG